MFPLREHSAEYRNNVCSHFYHAWWTWVHLICTIASNYLPHQWASYQIRKIAGCACAGNAGSNFPATDLKKYLLLAIPTCITARMSCTYCDAYRDRLTRDGGENIPGIPAHAQSVQSWQKMENVEISKFSLTQMLRYIFFKYPEVYFPKNIYEFIIINIIVTFKINQWTCHPAAIPWVTIQVFYRPPLIPNQVPINLI